MLRENPREPLVGPLTGGPSGDACIMDASNAQKKKSRLTFRGETLGAATLYAAGEAVASRTLTGLATARYGYRLGVLAEDVKIVCHELPDLSNLRLE
ncbi:hypothetical protein cyc_01994 [Cyclospora cayetanensis]|uniref:Uncharacterized protein n=1 Tax=Cyclospora cayetanensis TaxID=88456 RepID=A0A1D3CTX2_9EIME|nr:hypothetical protein cyc_01994 [Cyclospora cayetanensis]